MMFLQRMFSPKKARQLKNRQSEVIVDQVKKLLQEADQSIILMVRR
ncbi:MAG: hypothetical protein HYW45_02640 [Candidatus Daviesbacteria bacterium]|nr:MAG: hypothetical protein HYW45_02640 [Candidatus Daviesbacteria bacterium]